MAQNPALDGLKEAHERNEAQLQMLEKEVQRATSPPTMTGSAVQDDEEDERSHSRSPQSLASALFSRKPKSKSKSKSKSSSSSASAGNVPARGASQAELKSLHEKVEQARNNEMSVVSSAIGISSDGTELNADGQDDVLDLADQLLAQLDAKEREIEGGDGLPTSGYANASVQGVPIAAPQPIPGATATLSPTSSIHHVNSTSSMASNTSVSSSTSGTGVSRKSSNSSRQGFGAKLKEAFSPPSSNSSSITEASAGGVHKNRHALRKEKKQAEDERLRAEAQAEVDAGRANGRLDPGEAEKLAMQKLLRQYNLEVIDIEPDGHCMYSAIADQLNCKKILKKSDYKTTRKVAADYMRKHMDEFLPYLPAEDEQGQGEGLLSPEGYMKHCDNVENTGEWGSETEILALSQHFQVPIYVFQAGSPLVKVGEDAKYARKEPLTISYHRHQYGSGEHYNSLRPVPHHFGMLGAEM